MTAARRLWQHIEPVHAVTYFAPEVEGALAALGLRGFWMGYFAARAAPMGEVTVEVVTATFFGFSPSRTHRAIPDAWSIAPPAAVLAARDAAVLVALRSSVGGALDGDRLARAVGLAEQAAGACERAGRPLAAAHADLPPADDPLLRLWQLTAVLREHRGDGHNVALVVAGLDGCSANVLAEAAGVVPPGVQQRSRGWSDDDWAAARDHLTARGVLDASGEITAAGRALRDEVEATTDRLAEGPVTALGAGGVDELCGLLRPAVDAIVGGGTIPFPNPIGLTPPT